MDTEEKAKRKDNQGGIDQDITTTTTTGVLGMR